MIWISSYPGYSIFFSSKSCFLSGRSLLSLRRIISPDICAHRKFEFQTFNFTLREPCFAKNPTAAWAFSRIFRVGCSSLVFQAPRLAKASEPQTFFREASLLLKRCLFILNFSMNNSHSTERSVSAFHWRASKTRCSCILRHLQCFIVRLVTLAWLNQCEIVIWIFF